MKLEYNYKVEIESNKTAAEFCIREPYDMLNFLLQIDVKTIKLLIQDLDKLEAVKIDKIENWGYDQCLVTFFKEQSKLNYTGYDPKENVIHKNVEIPTGYLYRLFTDWVKLSTQHG